MQTLQQLKTKILNDHLTQEEALDFFKLLFDDSVVRCKTVCPNYKSNFPTDQFGKGWLEGTPVGVMDHHTASSNVQSALQWFSSYDKWPKTDPKTGKPTTGKGNASSAFVVDTNGDIYCLIKFWENQYDWHEPQVSRKCLGIEHVSCGPLKNGPDGKFYWWPKDWTSPYPLMQQLPPVTLKVQYRGMSYYQPYTREQLISNVIIKRALVSLYPNRMRKELFIDHATVRADKFDMGPLWPLDLLRNLAFSGDKISDHKELMTFTKSLGAQLDTIDHADLETLLKDKLSTKFLETQLSGEEIDRKHIQEKLVKLGYNTNTDGKITPQYDQAVRSYQLHIGIKVDGIVGPITQAAIEAEANVK